ncbi:MAG: aldehyde dehydrogenase family protein [Pseudomonadota bacterium]
MDHQYQFLIDGDLVAADRHSGIHNPATGQPLGQCPIATRDDLERAVAAAKTAFPQWRDTADEERQAACHRVAQLFEDHAEDIARLITQEQGKTLVGIGSRFEVGGCAAWARHTADLPMPIKVLQNNHEGRVEMLRKPVGVVGSITPWNWPLLIAVWHMLPAIRSGCTLVMKPSPYTPLSTLYIGQLIAGVLPKGVVNIVSGDDQLGAWMTEHEDIQKIVFTGSIPTGRRIMGAAAPTLKRLTLELGGNDAGIVLPDCDPSAIAEGLFWGAFINNGQTCAALKRLYVHEEVFEGVCTALAGIASQIPVGNGLDEANVLGPLQNEMQFRKVIELVDDAKANGARVLTGGQTLGDIGYFYAPTLLGNVDQGMRIVQEEQFGPALPIIKISSVEEGIALANDSETGLGGSVWTNDGDAARHVATQLECGSVWINAHGMIAPHVPFGGVKSSGIGVEFGEEGLHEYTTIQAIHGLSPSVEVPQG